MSRTSPAHLKLHTTEPEVVRPDMAQLAALGDLCDAFTTATGWPLRYIAEPELAEPIDLVWSAPVNPGVGATPGHLRIDLIGPTSAGEDRIDWHAAEALADQVGRLVNELAQSQHALWQREAELAAGVPVSSHGNEAAKLAERLEATLKAGADSLGCHSAALYLLDEGTSELKLRSCFGLPREKLREPARPLANQMADLEALLGHALALESTADMVGPWRSPEPAKAALCVPVSSPTMPLGTLWFFCNRARPFSDEQTNLAEVVAGKIAGDLDRAMLLAERNKGATLEKQMAIACETQEQSLPTESPPLEGWQACGWAAQASAIGGAYYDWQMVDNASFLALLGDACDGGVQGALASAALRGALREDNPEFPPKKSRGKKQDIVSRPRVERLIERGNRVLWECSAGQWWAGLCAAEIDLKTGECQIATAGRPTVLWLRPEGWASLVRPTPAIGLDAICRPQSQRLILGQGEALIAYNRGVAEACDERGRPLDEAAVARALQTEYGATPERLIEIVRDRLEAHAVNAAVMDRGILVVQRLP